MRRLVDHLAGILLIGGALALLSVLVARHEESQANALHATFDPLLTIPGLDLGNPLHAAMLRETMRAYAPGGASGADSLMDALLEYRQRSFTDPFMKSGGMRRGLNQETLTRLGWMYAQFVILFGIAMLLSYYGARTLAIYRFVRRKQGGEDSAEHVGRQWSAWRTNPGLPTLMGVITSVCVYLLLRVMRGVVYAILFSPAYVVAYALRTRIDTSTSGAMIVLAVLTNGLLVSSANRLFTLLMAESRKGYVLTAIVKNLQDSYSWGKGIPLAALFFPRQLARTHVFHHIYLNARYQYLPAIKEHVSFLITGLIIIEMALNIQNHLGYELLQSVLYRNIPVIATIVFGIYLLVKATEIAVEFWFQRMSRRYENRTEQR
jgi:hypothetical protein